MAVPRAKKKAKAKDPSVPDEWERRRIMEGNWIVIATALFHGWNYYKYRRVRLERLLNLYEAQLTKYWQRPGRYRQMLAEYDSRKYTTKDIKSMCDALGEYKSEVYKLTLGCMILALHEMKWSKKRIDGVVLSVFHTLHQGNDLHWFLDNVRDTIGIDVRTEVVWK